MAKKPYADLADYLNRVHYNELISPITGFVIKNRSCWDFSTNFIPYPFDNIKVHDFKITSLYTEMKADDYVLIHCNTYADVLVRGYVHGRKDNGIDEDGVVIWHTILGVLIQYQTLSFLKTYGYNVVYLLLFYFSTAILHYFLGHFIFIVSTANTKLYCKYKMLLQKRNRERSYR